jgi:hypothetical protein
MKVWPIDPLVLGSFKLEVPEKLPQVRFLLLNSLKTQKLTFYKG